MANTRVSNPRAIFVNKAVNLGELDVFGFDFDYTLVTYTNALAEFIFKETIGVLVWDLKVAMPLYSCSTFLVSARIAQFGL